MVVAGAGGGMVVLFFLAGIPHANPEPDPGGLAASLLAMVALGGALAAVGGTYRGAIGGAMGCVFVPLTMLICHFAVGMLTRQSIGLGWLWWWPCAIVFMIPSGASVGLSAQLGARLFRRTRSPRRAFGILGIVLLLVYSLTWSALYTVQVARDRPLTKPMTARPAPSPAERPTFPDRMPKNTIGPTDVIQKPHAE
jgi:hypothetical protein